MLAALSFYLFAGLTLGSGLMVITARNPVHSVFFLILSFFSSAGLFVLLGAEFLAMLLVVVYVGAVAVLFLFVVMMLDIPVPSNTGWFFEKLKATTYSSFKLISYLVIFSTFFYLMVPALGFVLSKGLSVDIMDEGRFIMAPLSELRDVFARTSGFDVFKWIGLFVTFGFSMAMGRFVAMKVLRQDLLTLVANVFSQSPAGVVVSLLLMGEFAVLATLWGSTEIASDRALVPLPPVIELPNTHTLGQYIYTEYIYVFQTAGMILLVAMIAAIVLTQRTRTGVRRQNIYDQNNRHPEDAVELVKVKSGEGIGKWK